MLFNSIKYFYFLDLTTFRGYGKKKCCFLGVWKDKIICFRDLLTFRAFFKLCPGYFSKCFQKLSHVLSIGHSLAFMDSKNINNKRMSNIWHKMTIFTLLYITRYRTRATITRSWKLTIYKARILKKKPLEKTFLDFKKWVKSIQIAGYNGARMV